MSQALYVRFAIVALMGVTVGYSFGTGGEMPAVFATTPGAPSGVNLAPVFDVWTILNEKFVVSATSSEVLSDDEKVWGLVQGLANAYGDPYTVFLPPEEQKLFEEDIRGTFGGIGVEIGKRKELLTVIAPMKGTPAMEAGLLSGDIIIEIDGKSTQRMTIDDAVRAIRGEIGTEVVLKIADEESREFREVTIARAEITVPTLETELRADGVFVIELYSFTGSSHTMFRDAMREFLESKSRALIVDLRGNSGGYLDSSVDIASWFLPLGETVVKEDYGTKRGPLVHRSKGYDVVPRDARVALLVDGGSASAAEILAGALQDHEVAPLVGAQTFGKGSVQEIIPVTDDSALKVTVARWLTPNGRSISDGGLTPDLIVARSREDSDADKDPQLDVAVTFVLTGSRVLPDATSTATSTDDRL